MPCILFNFVSDIFYKWHMYKMTHYLQKTVCPSLVMLQCVEIRSNLTAGAEELASVAKMDSPYSVFITTGFCYSCDYFGLPLCSGERLYWNCFVFLVTFQFLNNKCLCTVSLLQNLGYLGISSYSIYVFGFKYLRIIFFLF